MKPPIEMTVASIEEIAPALDWIEAWGQDAGLAPRRAHRVMLVVEELAVNALRYRGMNAGGGVTIRLRTEEDAVLAEVVHEGAAFDTSDPGNVPPVDPMRAGGDGLRLVHAITDSIEYDHHDGRNRTSVRIV